MNRGQMGGTLRTDEIAKSSAANADARKEAVQCAASQADQAAQDVTALRHISGCVRAVHR